MLDIWIMGGWVEGDRYSHPEDAKAIVEHRVNKALPLHRQSQHILAEAWGGKNTKVRMQLDLFVSDCV